MTTETQAQAPKKYRSGDAVLPTEVQIVGVDFGDENTPGYDPRLKMPGFWDEDMVKSIRLYGVKRVVIVRRDGPNLVKVDGMRRILHARAANKQIEDEATAAGQKVNEADLIRVRIDIQGGNELGSLITSRIANAYAVTDDAATNAANAQKMLDKGASMEEVRLAFGVKESTVKDWLQLLRADPTVAEMHKAGELSGNAVLALTELSMADQVKALQIAAADVAAQGKPGKLTTAAVKDAAAKIANPNDPKLTPKARLSNVQAHLNVLLMKVSKQEDPREVPDTAAMFDCLRKIAKAINPAGKTFDQQVKALVLEAKALEA